jgi:hypothetical protein
MPEDFRHFRCNEHLAITAAHRCLRFAILPAVEYNTT